MNYRARSNVSLFAALAVSAFIVGTTDYIFPPGNITNSVLVFLRFLPEFIGGMVLYFLYERGLPGWFSRDGTCWLSFGALPVLEWIHVPNGMIICVLGMVLLTSATNQGRPARLLNAPVFAYLGEISYSLYMVQGLVMVIAYKIHVSEVPILYGVVMLGLSLPLAAVISPAFEYPARDWLKRFRWPTFMRAVALRRCTSNPSTTLTGCR